MSPTASFRVTESQKLLIDRAINEISDQYPDIENKGDAISKIIIMFKDGYTPPERDYSTQIRNTISDVECDYLRYEGAVNGFVCNEDFHKKRKSIPIGGSPDLVQIRCFDCKRRKAELKQIQQDKMLQKDSIRKILDIRKAILTTVGEGIEVDVYMCKCTLKQDGNLQLSYNNENLYCSLVENELVDVTKFCKEKMNPKTGSLPCQHLISMHHAPKIDLTKFKSSDQDINEIKLMLPALTDDKPKKNAKIVDAEVSTIVVKTGEKGLGMSHKSLDVESEPVEDDPDES